MTHRDRLGVPLEMDRARDADDTGADDDHGTWVGV